MRNISYVAAMLVFAFLVGGVVLVLTNHPTEANLLLGVAVGTVTGTGATAAVVATSNGGQLPEPKPPA